MAYGTPTDPVAGTVITVAWAVTNVLDPIRQLRLNTGSADPSAVNRIAISTGVGGPSTWQQVPTDAILNGAVSDVKMATQKVSKTAPTYASFAAAAAELSSFCYINNPGSIVDAPVPSTLDWLLIQVRHPVAPTYGWQLTVSQTDQNELYARSIIAGVGGTWRRVFHAGNLDALLRAGGTMTGNITFSDDDEGVIFASGSMVRDHGSGEFQIIANNGTVRFYGEAATPLLATITAAFAIFNGQVQAPSATLTGALNAVSAALSGALNAASATLTGALSAASAAITDISGTNAILSNVVQGLRLVSTQATGTPPLTVASTTKVANLNADKLDDLDSTDFAPVVHVHGYATAVTMTYTGNSSGSTRAVALGVSVTPVFAFVQIVAGSTAQGVIVANHDGLHILPGSPGSIGTAVTGFSFSAGVLNVPPGAWNTSGLTYRVTMFGY